MKKILSIEGMSCGHCTSRVEKALNELEGVKVVSVSVEDKNAVIELKENITDEVLKETIEEIGFDVLNVK